MIAQEEHEDAGDYTLTVFLTIDRQDDRLDTDGRLLPPDEAAFYGKYCIEAGREDGA